MIKTRLRPTGDLIRYGEEFRPKQGIDISYCNHWPRFFLLLLNIVIGQYKLYLGLVTSWKWIDAP